MAQRSDVQRTDIHHGVVLESYSRHAGKDGKDVVEGETRCNARNNS